MQQSIAADAFVSSHWLGITLGAVAMWSLVVFSRSPLYERGTTVVAASGRPNAIGMLWRFIAMLLLAVIIALLEESRGVNSLFSAALIGALVMLLPAGYHLGRASKTGTVRSDIAHVGLSLLGGIVCAVVIYVVRFV
jgi:hypothetical protein